jgi:filamentous hemagglutinin family protein
MGSHSIDGRGAANPSAPPEMIPVDREHQSARSALAMLALCAAKVVAAPPTAPLPVPCVAGTCGTSAQSFVSYGSAGATFAGTTATITQGTNKAILNWASFNIANGYTVNFVQPSATAEILNNIWSGNPSVIAGQMNANGQVYLYNQNGIVFDKGAQINVAGLTASTLGFAPSATSTDPDALFENGMASSPKTRRGSHPPRCSWDPHPAPRLAPSRSMRAPR